MQPYLLLPIHRPEEAYWAANEKRQTKFRRGLEDHPYLAAQLAAHHWPPWLVNDLLGFLAIDDDGGNCLLGIVYLKLRFLPRHLKQAEGDAERPRGMAPVAPLRPGIELSRRPRDRHSLRLPTPRRDRLCPGQACPACRTPRANLARRAPPPLGRARPQLHAPAWPDFDGPCGARGTTTLVRFVLRFPLPFDRRAPHHRRARPGRTRHALEPSCRARQKAPRPARTAAAPALRAADMPQPSRRAAAAAGAAAGTASARETSSRRRSTAASRCQPARAAQRSRAPVLLQQAEPQLTSAATRQLLPQRQTAGALPLAARASSALRLSAARSSAAEPAARRRTMAALQVLRACPPINRSAGI
jgi:hypothetical protein